MDSTAFGDRMKEYERVEAGRRLMPLLPVIARLDGRCFSKLTKGLERPFDSNFAEIMLQVTIYLVEETAASVGYTQSDEISLVWYAPDRRTQLFFNLRTQKMVSTLAAMASVKFNALLPEHLPEKVGFLPSFDCRVWNVPTPMEASNTLLWREVDATRNSVQMAARSVYNHKRCYGKSGPQLQEMLFQKGINWNDYPDRFKRGAFVQRKTNVREQVFTSEEIAKLPEKHHARQNPELVIERSEVRVVEMPPFMKVTNRVGVLFRGEDPVIAAKPHVLCPDCSPTGKATGAKQHPLRRSCVECHAKFKPSTED